jgi:hypothetical protein
MRHLVVAAAILTAAYLLLLVTLNLGLRPAVETTGGLDGCLVTADGSAIPGRVRVGDKSVDTYADGCFFFAALPAGVHAMEVEAEDAVWTQSVTIMAGEAVMLGAVTAP